MESVGSYARLIDFVFHSTLGVGVVKRRRVGIPGPVFRQVHFEATPSTKLVSSSVPRRARV